MFLKKELFVGQSVDKYTSILKLLECTLNQVYERN